VMPVRNAESTVEVALKSVLRGLDRDSRVLVLNDASDDGTAAVLNRLARLDRRVGILTSDVPSGVAGALNSLIEHADTDLIARMDADDISLPWRFALQLRALERQSADLVFAPAVRFGPSKYRYLPQPPLALSPAAVPLELLVSNTLLHPTLVGRRRTIREAGGYRPVPAEDWDLWMRLALRGDRVARVAPFVLLYRIHAQQVSATADWRAAHATNPMTKQAHQSLARKLLGDEHPGAYEALLGGGNLDDALGLIDGVLAAARRLGATDRAGIYVNSRAVKRGLVRHGVADGR
jgi:glycosyltransferase involved in cell wall biosynthesis